MALTSAERSRKHYVAHRAQRCEKSRLWRKNNPDKVKIQKSRPGARAGALRHYYKHRELYIKRVREWQKAHPDQHYLNSLKALVKRRYGTIGHFHKHDLEILLITQAGRCAYCNVCLYDGYEIDHVIPLSKGGTNWPDNVALACKPCNRAKAAKLNWKVPTSP